MFLTVGRLEIYLCRSGPLSRDILPEIRTGGDPIGKTLWVWWLGHDLVTTLMPPRKPLRRLTETDQWMQTKEYRGQAQ